LAEISEADVQAVQDTRSTSEIDEDDGELSSFLG
jgi:hypothetical protein